MGSDPVSGDSWPAASCSWSLPGGEISGEAARGEGTVYESLMSRDVLVRLAMMGCRREFGEMVLKLNFFACWSFANEAAMSDADWLLLARGLR